MIRRIGHANNHERRARSAPLGILLGLAILAFGAGCSGESSESAIAVVGDHRITEAAFAAAVEHARDGDPTRLATPTERRHLLEEMIRREVLVQRAREAGYADHPDVVAATRRALIGQYQDEVMRSRVADIRVEPRDVLAEYDRRKDAFTTPERRHMAVLQIDAPARLREDARQRRRERTGELRASALAAPDGRADFGRLAMEHSDHRASRYRGGDAGWIASRGRESLWPTELVDAVFALDAPGAISEVVETPGAFYLARLIEVEPAKARPIEAVSEGIRRELLSTRRAEAYDAFLDEQFAAVSVEIDEAALSALAVAPGSDATVAHADPTPPSMPEL